jgi:hypothetical protein
MALPLFFSLRHFHQKAISDKSCMLKAAFLWRVSRLALSASRSVRRIATGAGGPLAADMSQGSHSHFVLQRIGTRPLEGFAVAIRMTMEEQEERCSQWLCKGLHIAPNCLGSKNM